MMCVLYALRLEKRHMSGQSDVRNQARSYIYCLAEGIS